MLHEEFLLTEQGLAAAPAAPGQSKSATSDDWFDAAFDSFVSQLYAQWKDTTDGFGGRKAQLRRWRESLNLPAFANDQACCEAIDEARAAGRVPQSYPGAQVLAELGCASAATRSAWGAVWAAFGVLVALALMAVGCWLWRRQQEPTLNETLRELLEGLCSWQGSWQGRVGRRRAGSGQRASGRAGRAIEACVPDRWR